MHYFRLFVYSVVLCLSLNGYAAQVAWIYGAQAAKMCNKTADKYYISVGSFKNRQYAEAMQAKLRAAHISGVHRYLRHGLVNLSVGPLFSCQAVRSMGGRLSVVLSSPHHKGKPRYIQARVIPPPQHTEVKQPASKVLTVSLGASWTNGSTVTDTLAPEVVNTYVANNHGPGFLVGEIFYGMERALPFALSGQLGIALGAGGDAKLSGDIWENADPDFNNATYQYRMNRVYLGLKGKLLKQTKLWIEMEPYVSGTISVSFNHAYHYGSTPLIPEEVAAPPFGSNVTPALSYAFGAGIQKSLNAQWSGAVGYEFSDWGRNRLYRAPEQEPTYSLSLNHLYNNALLFNLSYHG